MRESRVRYRSASAEQMQACQEKLKADPAKPGYAFVTALAKLMERTGMDKLAMSGFNINKDDLPKVAHIAAAEVGFECDRYTVTEADVVEILMQSYK